MPSEPSEPSEPSDNTPTTSPAPEAAGRAFVLLWLGLLFAPLLLYGHPGALVGVTAAAPRPVWGVQAWTSRAFQAGWDAHFQAQFGLRAAMVRMTNQLNHSLFRVSQMQSGNLVIGQQGQLYSRASALLLCDPLDSTGRRQIEDVAASIARLAERLHEEGTPLLLWVTPSKAAVYPEHLPRAFCRGPRPGSAYPVAISALAALAPRGVTVLDSTARLRSERSRYDDVGLFSPCGHHWNRLGAHLATRDLLAWLKREVGRAPLLTLEGYARAFMRGDSDTDYADLLNLLQPPTCPSALPRLAWRRGDLSAPLSLMVVGGSFSQLPLDQLVASGAFDRLEHYYYFRRELRSLVQGTVQKNPDVTRIDWAAELQRVDAVVLEVNMADLRMPHVTAFVDTALRALSAR